MIMDQFTMYDAAYVLGALSPSDRREFENHLKVCSACARSVGELAGLPGLMSRVSIDQLTAEPEPVPETLLPSLARAVRRQRVSRRLGVGAAVCLVAVAGVATNQSDSPARQPAASTPSASPGSTAGSSADLALQAVVDNSPVTASARLFPLAWGTRIDLTCTYDAAKRRPAPGGLPYALVVVDRKGAAEQVATWKALPNRTLTLMGTSSRDRADIAAVEVRTMKGRTILRLSI